MKKYIYLIILAAAAVIYAVVIIPTWGESYLDFGDGNYIYISQRMAEGRVLYKDILAPQPPLHLYLGKFISYSGKLFGMDSPLTPFRAYSLLLHIATFLMVFAAGKKFFENKNAALTGALIYMILPIGFWWTRGYQSEPTEVLLLLFAFYYLADFTKKSMFTASLFSILAVLTNMTAAPYIFFNLLFLAIRKRKLFLYYFLPFAVGLIIVMMFFEIRTGRYFENVFFNQVGSYPKKELYPEGVLHYAFNKIASEGKDILIWEGMYVFISLLGIIKYIKLKSEKPEKEFITFFTICALGSFIFVTKGGTMDYIFTIGDPWQSMFAGFFIYNFMAQYMPAKKEEYFNLKDLSPLASAALLITAFFICSIIGILNVRGTLMEKSDELSNDKVQEVKFFIEKYSKPGDVILAPPFYAVVGGRAIFEDYSEIFLWTIKYWNEVKVDKKPGLGVEKIKSIEKALNEKRLPLVIIESAQTGQIPEITAALEKNYQWAPPLQKPFATMNTQLLIMIPREK